MQVHDRQVLVNVVVHHGAHLFFRAKYKKELKFLFKFKFMVVALFVTYEYKS